MNTTTVEMSLHLSKETNEILNNLCEENNLTTSDFLRKSIALMQLALKYKKNEGHLVVVDRHLSPRKILVHYFRQEIRPITRICAGSGSSS